MADGRKIISTTSIVSFIIRYGMLRNGPWLGHPFRHPTKWPDRSGTGLDWPGRTWKLGLSDSDSDSDSLGHRSDINGITYKRASLVRASKIVKCENRGKKKGGVLRDRAAGGSSLDGAHIQLPPPLSDQR